MVHQEQRPRTALEERHRRLPASRRQGCVELLCRDHQSVLQVSLGVLLPGRVETDEAKRKATEIELTGEVAGEVREGQ